MERNEKVQYWIKSSEYDWKVSEHLFEKGDYPYSLYLGHLTIEKLLKALYVNKFEDTPPLTHRLTYIANKIELELSPDKLEILEIITGFNLEARYPDDKFLFYNKCTKEFTETQRNKINEIRKWLMEKIP